MKFANTKYQQIMIVGWILFEIKFKRKEKNAKVDAKWTNQPTWLVFCVKVLCAASQVANTQTARQQILQQKHQNKKSDVCVKEMQTTWQKRINEEGIQGTNRVVGCICWMLSVCASARQLYI